MKDRVTEELVEWMYTLTNGGTLLELSVLDDKSD
jgi:hypothetical protein